LQISATNGKKQAKGSSWLLRHGTENQMSGMYGPILSLCAIRREDKLVIQAKIPPVTPLDTELCWIDISIGHTKTVKFVEKFIFDRWSTGNPVPTTGDIAIVANVPKITQNLVGISDGVCVMESVFQILQVRIDKWMEMYVAPMEPRVSQDTASQWQDQRRHFLSRALKHVCRNWGWKEKEDTEEAASRIRERYDLTEESDRTKTLWEENPAYMNALYNGADDDIGTTYGAFDQSRMEILATFGATASEKILQDILEARHKKLDDRYYAVPMKDTGGVPPEPQPYTNLDIDALKHTLTKIPEMRTWNGCIANHTLFAEVKQAVLWGSHGELVLNDLTEVLQIATSFGTSTFFQLYADPDDYVDDNLEEWWDSYIYQAALEKLRAEDPLGIGSQVENFCRHGQVEDIQHLPFDHPHSLAKTCRPFIYTHVRATGGWEGTTPAMESLKKWEILSSDQEFLYLYFKKIHLQTIIYNGIEVSKLLPYSNGSAIRLATSMDVTDKPYAGWTGLITSPQKMNFPVHDGSDAVLVLDVRNMIKSGSRIWQLQTAEAMVSNSITWESICVAIDLATNTLLYENVHAKKRQTLLAEEEEKELSREPLSVHAKFEGEAARKADNAIAEVWTSTTNLYDDTEDTRTVQTAAKITCRYCGYMFAEGIKRCYVCQTAVDEQDETDDWDFISSVAPVIAQRGNFIATRTTRGRSNYNPTGEVLEESPQERIKARRYVKRANKLGYASIWDMGNNTPRDEKFANMQKGPDWIAKQRWTTHEHIPPPHHDVRWDDPEHWKRLDRLAATEGVVKLWSKEQLDYHKQTAVKITRVQVPGEPVDTSPLHHSEEFRQLVQHIYAGEPSKKRMPMAGAGREVTTSEAKQIASWRQREKDVWKKNEDSNVFPKKLKNSDESGSYYDAESKKGGKYYGREFGSYTYGSSASSSSQAGNNYWDRYGKGAEGSRQSHAEALNVTRQDWHQGRSTDWNPRWDDRPEPEAKRRAQPEQPLWINGELQSTGETIFSSHNPDRGAGKGRGK